MKNDELLHKWIQGELTPQELEEFKRRPEYGSLVKLYKHTESLQAPGIDVDAMLSDILREEKPVRTNRRVFLVTWVKYAAAACLLLIAGWYFFIRSGGEMVRYETAQAESKEGTLPDQSVFVLNAESNLYYDANTWEGNRSLQLEGEAFFKVQKGATFTVQTPSGSVQVLGTQFNVWARGRVLDVRCQEGKVAVKNTAGATVGELTPNQAIRLEPGKQPELYSITPVEIAGWVEGITRLRKVPLSVVLDELERQFNVTFHGKDTIDMDALISCNFQHEDLELALKTTVGAAGVEYEVRNRGEIYLTVKDE